MSHIYVVSASSAVWDKPGFKRGLERLRAAGHEVEVDASALARNTRFAGDDVTRLAAIARAAASGADIVMGARGGYGQSRLLAELPFKKIAKSIERGSTWVGYSDWTALQLGLFAKTGARSWQGPMVMDDFAPLTPEPVEGQKPPAERPDEIMLACFDDLALGVCEGAGWRLSKRENPTPPAKPIKGVLWGGNLAMITSLVGTGYLPPIKGGILWLEDVAEAPYRIERMLTQLLHAGVLAQQKAIILGQFTAHKPSSVDNGFSMSTVLAWLRSAVKAPVLTGLPFGHVATKVCLPQGAPVRLLVESHDALLYWG